MEGRAQRLFPNAVPAVSDWLVTPLNLHPDSEAREGSSLPSIELCFPSVNSLWDRNFPDPKIL
jgi:hypothetical protein